MKWGNQTKIAGALLACFSFAILVSTSVAADFSSSSNYKLDASVNNSFGGQSSSSSYGLVDSGGESVIGNGASGSYILAAGYSNQLTKSIQLTVPSSTLSFGALTPNTSKTVSQTLSVITDAAGYTISAAQNNNLQSGSNTIPAVSGSIASPVTWSEGNTKGLGLTLTSTNATAIPTKWSSGNAYAAVPGSATGIYTRTGQTGGATDTLGVRFRLDIAATQQPGTYSNTVSWTATTTP